MSRWVTAAFNKHFPGSVNLSYQATHLCIGAGCCTIVAQSQEDKELRINVSAGRLFSTLTAGPLVRGEGWNPEPCEQDGLKKHDAYH